MESSLKLEAFLLPFQDAPGRHQPKGAFSISPVQAPLLKATRRSKLKHETRRKQTKGEQITGFSGKMVLMRL